MTKKTIDYSIVAQNIYGMIAPEFPYKNYRTMAEALDHFDNLYSRKGWKIAIYKQDPKRCYEPVLVKIVKSTYR